MTFRRLVLDTNVLVSALQFLSGTVSWLRDAWQAQAVVPLASRDTTAELIRVLSYPKFQLTRRGTRGSVGRLSALVRDGQRVRTAGRPGVS